MTTALALTLVAFFSVASLAVVWLAVRPLDEWNAYQADRSAK